MMVHIRNSNNGTTFVLDLDADMTLQDLWALLALESDIESSNLKIQTASGGNVTGEPQQSLGALGVVDGMTLTISDKTVAAAAPAPADPFAAILQGMQQAQQQQQRQRPDRRQQLIQYRDQLRNDPYTLSILRQNRPDFAEAVVSDNLEAFQRIVEEDEKRKREAEAEQQRRRAELAANPFSIEAQRAMEEEIRQANVIAARQHAMEHMPETFGSVVMLYIDLEVNGVPLKAFVDSGAQTTIMSEACAERCNLSRLIDRQFAGTAVGVGTQTILGRVHMCDLKIAGDHLASSFAILQNQPMDVLLGLDMLKRHQCVIDLKRNVLTIGTTGNSTPFLSEKDIPAKNTLQHHAAGAAAAAKNATSPSSSDAQRFPDEDIAHLLQIGNFSREQVLQALQACSGDKERAAAHLFAMMQ